MAKPISKVYFVAGLAIIGLFIIIAVTSLSQAGSKAKARLISQNRKTMKATSKQNRKNCKSQCRFGLFHAKKKRECRQQCMDKYETNQANAAA